MKKKEPVKSECAEHKWRMISQTGWQSLHYACENCPAYVTRTCTPAERRLLKAERRIADKNSKALHKLCWAFRKALGDKKGWDAMEAARRFSARRPEVLLVGCDDDHHASSLLVLVPHENEYEYWGTTLFVIPQLSGEPMMEMFLYPGHRDNLDLALRNIQRKYKQPRAWLPPVASWQIPYDQPEKTHAAQVQNARSASAHRARRPR